MTGATGANPSAGLASRVRTLLDEAARTYRGRPGGSTLASVAARLDGPLRVAIVGRVKAGKSTLLNALVGARIAATDAGECTRVVTWYEHAAAASATAFGRSGPPAGLPLDRTERGWALDLGGRRPQDVDRVEVGLPSPQLRTMTLIDTPGLGSLTESAGRRTEEFLDDTGQVDAVLYLLRHLHASDVDFLDAFRDPASDRTGPVHAVGVLSRADELGGGVPGALEHAAQAAAGYRSDPLLRGLVYTVLPVAGLLAEAAAGLTAADLADLVALADAGPAATAPLVLSATRFCAPYNAVPVPPSARRRLLDTLGLFGVRLTLSLIRDGVRDAEALRAALHDRSGLTELRTLLLSQFAERRDVLKADGALRAVESVARLDPVPGARRLLQEVERIRGGAHELAELRLLGELRLGTVAARPELLAAMERLLGGQGTTPAARLALAPDSSPQDALAHLIGLHRDWTRTAQDRLSDPSLARAARVLQRTCEGLVPQVRALAAPAPAAGARATNSSPDNPGPGHRGGST